MRSIVFTKSLAAFAHKGQTDKGGTAYIEHPKAVAELLDDPTESEYRAALLHDVVEDTHYELEDLRRLGFSATVVNLVDALSRRDGEKYFDFIRRTRDHGASAIKVKRADITHNMDPNRGYGKGKTLPSGMVARYTKALAILSGEME
jgi:(p)ppGpp synthase/HD superfamily hydrolase